MAMKAAIFLYFYLLLVQLHVNNYDKYDQIGNKFISA